MKDSVNINGGSKVNIVVCYLFLFNELHILVCNSKVDINYYISLIRTGEQAIHG